MNDERVTDATPIPGTPGIAYGLGVLVRRDTTTDCVISLDHAGAEPGYGAYVTAYPTSGAVLAVIGNLDGGDERGIFTVVPALASVVEPLVIAPSTTSCAPSMPTPVATAPTPVATDPAFTG